MFKRSTEPVHAPAHNDPNLSSADGPQHCIESRALIIQLVAFGLVAVFDGAERAVVGGWSHWLPDVFRLHLHGLGLYMVLAVLWTDRDWRLGGERLGRPRVSLEVEKKIMEFRSTGKGMRKISRELGVGVSTVKRVIDEARVA